MPYIVEHKRSGRLITLTTKDELAPYLESPYLKNAYRLVEDTTVPVPVEAHEETPKQAQSKEAPKKKRGRPRKAAK